MRAVVSSVILIVLATAAGRTQEMSPARVNRMLDCSVHYWVPQKFLADGEARFNYLIEPATASVPADGIYVAFWNRTRKRGYFLYLGLYIEDNHRNHFVISNEGWIIPSARWGVELEDTLYGVWTYEHLMKRLHKLQKLPVLHASVKQIPHTSALCGWQ